MKKLYAISRSDGGVSIMLTEEEQLDYSLREWQLSCPEWSIVGVRAIAASERVPPTRAYRDAWCDLGNRIGHDMPKARELHRDKLRAARALLLAELDVAYQRADEDGDQQEKARVVAEKRRLRDITNDPRINAATTIEALAAITLDPPASATVKR